MARGPRATSSRDRDVGNAPSRGGKGRGRAKPQSGARAQKRSAAKDTAAKAATPTRKGAQKRTASKPERRRPSEQSQGWGSAVASLVTSALGRAILADVLEAAAAALKKERPEFERAGVDQIASPGEAATSVGSEMMSGTAALAQRAVSVLTEAVTEKALNALDGRSR
jgi:hypothetical protein